MHGLLFDLILFCVSDGPYMDEGPKTHSVLEGDPVFLICGHDLDSYPQPNISWTRQPDRQENLNDERYFRTDGPEIVGMNITSVGMSDNGTWTCTVDVMSSEKYVEGCSPNQENPSRRKEYDILLIVVSKLIWSILFQNYFPLLLQVPLVSHGMCMW